VAAWTGFKFVKGLMAESSSIVHR